VNSLGANVSGNNSVAMGFTALANSTGNNNVGLGANAGQNLTTGSNNIDIGSPGFAGDSGLTRIDGIDGTTVAGGVPVLVNGNGLLGTTTSSRRFKHDIRSLAPTASRLMRLRPVSFKYNAAMRRGVPTPAVRLIAEQVAKVYPNLVARDSKGRPYEVRYQELPALLLAQAQRQHAQSSPSGVRSPGSKSRSTGCCVTRE